MSSSKAGTKKLVLVAVAAFVAFVVSGATLWLGTAKAQQKAENDHLQQTESAGHQIYLATMQFVQNKNRFPNAATWEKDIAPYLPAGFSFALPGTPPHRWAFNPRFSNQKLDFLTPHNQAALFFESTATQAAPHDAFVSLAAGKNSDQKSFVLVGAGGGTYAYPNEYANLLNDPKTRKQITGE